jgi:galactokinase
MSESRVSLAALRERFCELFGGGAVATLRAPARINILGEHVDYVSYLPTASLPFGSHEHAMTMLWRARTDAQVCGATTHTAYEPFSFSLADYDITEQSWEEFLVRQPAPAPHWSNYVKGACLFARWHEGARVKNGFDFLIDSTIPPRGGSSSSSALTVLVGAAIRQANQVKFENAALAQQSAQAEWFCGTRGGALDHLTICLAQRGHAVHLLHGERRVDLVPLPAQGYRWLTFFSHEADKGSRVLLEYNERAAVARCLIPALLDDLQQHRAEFATGWQRALQALPSVDAFTVLGELLAELPPVITLAEFARHYPLAFQECERLFPQLVRGRSREPLKLYDRARHHLAETARVNEAVRRLRAAQQQSENRVDNAMHELGALLNAAHASLRDLYEVSTPEVERLREIIIADSQVYGARLMGGGFGGNVLALTTAANAPALIEHVQREYYAPQKRDGISEGAVMVSTPGDGLAELPD